MTTYYVKITGDDANGDGSETNPWATIGHAIDNSSYGDTIDIGEGTFNDDLPAGRVYRGAGMFKTTINGIFTRGGLTYSNAFIHAYDLTVNLNADITGRIETFGYSNDYGFIFEHIRVFGDNGNYGADGSEYMYGRFKIIRSIFDGIKSTGDLFMPYGGTTVPNLYMINSIVSRTGGTRWATPLNNGRGNLIKNCILYSAGYLDLRNGSLILSDWIHRYNAYYQWSIEGDTLDETEEIISIDPFVDIANGDFRLSEDSIISFGEPV